MNWAAVNKRTGVVELWLHDTKEPTRWFESCDHLRFVKLDDEFIEELILPFLHTTRLVLTHINPPIPLRDHDWGVSIDGQEEEGYRSYGATEAEALLNFALDYTS